MSTRRGLVLGAASIVTASGSSLLPSRSLAQAQPPAMPARNSWLADSVYPTSHFNGGATDSVVFAGPAKGKRLVRGRDAKVVSNVMVSNPAIKKIGPDTVGFASGTLGILKILLTGTALETVWTPLKTSPTAIPA
jgi:hypothetical protein